MKYVIVIDRKGYVGCKLIPALLEENYKAPVFDLMIYGNEFAEKKIVNILKRVSLKNIRKNLLKISTND